MMRSILDDFLDMSKIESGVLHFEKIGFELALLAKQCVQSMASKCKEKGIRIRLRLNQVGLPRKGYADPTRIKQLILNLLTNGPSPHCTRALLRLGSRLDCRAPTPAAVSSHSCLDACVCGMWLLLFQPSSSQTKGRLNYLWKVSQTSATCTCTPAAAALLSRSWADCCSFPFCGTVCTLCYARSYCVRALTVCALAFSDCDDTCSGCGCGAACGGI
jgi:hypothetical protein